MLKAYGVVWASLHRESLSCGGCRWCGRRRGDCGCWRRTRCGLSVCMWRRLIRLAPGPNGLHARGAAGAGCAWSWCGLFGVAWSARWRDDPAWPQRRESAGRQASHRWL